MPDPSGWAPHGQPEYADGFANLLPRGPAWPREQESVLMRFIGGLAALWGKNVDPRASDLLTRESDPRATVEMLDSWETAFGLPDHCVAEPLTVGDRQRALVSRMTLLGGQSRQFFIDVAASLGYTITIHEYSPFMAGVSQVGDTRPTGTAGEFYAWEMGAPEMRFYWTIRVGQVRFTWFRVTEGQAGVDPHLRIALATDLECVIRRYAPAHTQVVFDYSGLGTPDPMAGTP